MKANRRRKTKKCTKCGIIMTIKNFTNGLNICEDCKNKMPTWRDRQ